MQCLRGCEEGARFPRAGVIDGRKSPCGNWKLNLGPLEKHPLLLATEPSLQRKIKKFLKEFMLVLSDLVT